jgi:hypothetical protein
MVSKSLVHCTRAKTSRAGSSTAFPPLYADNSARYAETGVTPRAAARSFTRQQDRLVYRLVYGTDMGFDPKMYGSRSERPQ